MTTPSWITPAGFLVTATELQSFSRSVVATGTGTTLYSLISGNLPAGVDINITGVISGSPTAVTDVTRNKFVIRAKNGSRITDRTFYIDVTGADDPVWSTAAGYLSVGVAGEQYALNNQWVDFTVAATATQAPTGTKLKYYIANDSGKLPPGLILSESGRISGFVKDTLTVDGEISASGGYDDEAYDNYSYDHTTSFAGNSGTDLLPGVPKIYQFKITATDGVSRSVRLFKILVSSTDILNYNTTSMPIDIVLPSLSSGSIYVQNLQWLNGTDLGSIRAENNQIVPVTVYDPEPLVGSVVYSVVTGTNDLTQIPDGLSLETSQGYLYGFIPYQPAYTRNYTLTVNATKTVVQSSTSSTSITATNTFTLAVKGNVETSIQWISATNLGRVEAGVPSEIAIVASQIDTGYSIKYMLTAGSLPTGLILERDGSISGAAEYSSTGTYTFTVLATDIYELSSITRSFNIEVYKSDNKEYTKIYFKPFFDRAVRNKYNEFITDKFTFDPALIYRYYDTNFGIQPDIKLVLDFGIERINLADYTVALRENFYRKRFYFGEVKKALAKDSAGTVIYEVVYIDVIDDMVNNAGVSASNVVYTNSDIYYPGSIENMRRQLHLLSLENGSYIGVNEYNEPRFMHTPQEGDYKPPNYMRVIPICYALPGQGDRIISRIKLSGFDFRTLDFEVDRIIVEKSKDNSTAKYLLLERQAMGDNIEVDNYLFGPDWAAQPEGSVQLDNETNNPILRK